jgi:hypothetical protein
VPARQPTTWSGGAGRSTGPLRNPRAWRPGPSLVWRVRRPAGHQRCARPDPDRLAGRRPGGPTRKFPPRHHLWVTPQPVPGRRIDGDRDQRCEERHHRDCCGGLTGKREEIDGCGIIGGAGVGRVATAGRRPAGATAASAPARVRRLHRGDHPAAAGPAGDHLGPPSGEAGRFAASSSGVRGGRPRLLRGPGGSLCPLLPGGVAVPAGRLPAVGPAHGRPQRPARRPGRGAWHRRPALGRAAPRGSELAGAVRAGGPVPAGAAGPRAAALARGRPGLGVAGRLRWDGADRPGRRGGGLEPQAPDHPVPPPGGAAAQDRGPAGPLRRRAGASGRAPAAGLGAGRPRGRLCRPGASDPRLPPVHRHHPTEFVARTTPPDGDGERQVDFVQDVVAAAS